LSRESTPEGRFRLVHNPSFASGTGEHPCTQLALAALEGCVAPGSKVIDIGAGSGILAIAARLLGAASAVGLDTDETPLDVARENHALNGLAPQLIVGSADCLVDCCANIVVANINATVLLSIADELLHISAPGGRLILTGFTEPELPAIERNFPASAKRVQQSGEWVCVNLGFAT
jgi:ribosomal protein L11 methyltransferase